MTPATTGDSGRARDGADDGRDRAGLAFDAAYYDANRQDRDRPALLLYARLARRAIRGGPVLDFGCGTGFMSRRLARSFETYAFDASPFARSRVASTSPTTRVVESTAEIGQSVLGGIVSLHVLEHIDRRALPAVLADWTRMLRTGGRCLVVVPERDGLGHRLKGDRWIGFTDPTHVTLAPRGEWHAIFERAGLRVVEEGTDGLWDFPYAFPSWSAPRNALHRLRTGAQFAAGRLLLPPGQGESAVFVLERDGD